MSENEFVIDTSLATFKDQDDNILVQGKLLDLHYTIAEMARKAADKQITNEELYTNVARVFMEKFQPNGKDIEVSWATAMAISIKIQKRMSDEKKS